MSKFIIGFTGGRGEPSLSNRQYLDAFLRSTIEAEPNVEAHHGDCVGADAYFHRVCLDFQIPKIVVHPPTDAKYRAWCTVDPLSSSAVEILREYPYIERDHHIVDESNVLVALPERPHLIRSGTWATVRQALRVGKPVVLPPAWYADLELARIAVRAR